MTQTFRPSRPSRLLLRANLRRSGFTLVELLTVLFIIALLIGILIPSLSSARNAAKKAGTKAVFAALETGLESFKNENERDFRATHGYPPSFAHPPIGDTFDPSKGEFPFLESKPVVFGAHWLPAMLLGTDTLGYASRRSVPEALKAEPWKWYESVGGSPVVERKSLYLDPGGLRMIPTKDLPGAPNTALFPNWEDIPSPGVLVMRDLPVIVDSFEQPILYYAASAFGSPRNMLERKRDANNRYRGKGPPYYFHQDNDAFTGRGLTKELAGWEFGDDAHDIALPGNDLTAADIDAEIQNTEGKNVGTFARFIHDRKAHLAMEQTMEETALVTAPLKPVNPDSYLLISAGVDGRFGTNDDVTNFSINEPG